MPDAATNPNLSEDCLSDFWRTPDHETSIHIFRYTSGALDFPEHCHGEFSINIALEHPLSYRVGNSVETVERGKALIIRPGEWHAGVYPLHRAPLGLTISVTECALKLLLQKMGTNLDLEKTQINLSRIAEDSRLLPLAEEMAHEIQGRAPGRHVVMASLLTLFLTLLLRLSLEPVAEANPKPLARQLPAWQMVRSVEYMNSCRKRQFSLAGLCGMIGTSQSRFIQLFHNSTNVSPLACYNALLINKSKQLLLNSNQSIKEIARDLEFKNESHFCTLFHSVSGITPGKFRRFHKTWEESVFS